MLAACVLGGFFDLRVGAPSRSGFGRQARNAAPIFELTQPSVRWVICQFDKPNGSARNLGPSSYSLPERVCSTQRG